MVQISLQNSGGKAVFYGWVPRTPPPWAPTGVKVPWLLKDYRYHDFPNTEFSYFLTIDTKQ